ncbi:MAG: TonB-dependent receptor [Bacteroidota bacterium]
MSINKSKKTVALVLFLASITSFAATIRGTITDEQSSPLPGVTVQIQGTSLGTITNADGTFVISNLTEGSYNLLITSVGFQQISKTVTVKQQEVIQVNFVLKESSEELGEVVVLAKSETQLLSQQPITVAMVDVQNLQSQPVEIARVLDDLPGIRIQQSGGFGSSTQIQLNGATGEAVRVYLDGVPIEYLSSGTSLNTFPVNLIKRLEVYKGVMPIDLGTDALAGGINVVTREPYQNFLDVSYEVGSFNTHRGTLNSYLVRPKGFFIGINSFYNYSDNDFWMNVENQTYTTRDNGSIIPDDLESIRVRRFHNVHESYFAELHLGLRNKSWADELSYRVAYTHRYDENQHGSRVTEIPAGDAFQEEDGFIQRLKFVKIGLLNEKLYIKYDGSLNHSNNFVNDSTTLIYDWNGRSFSGLRGQGTGFGEIGAATLRSIEQVSTSQRLSLIYNFSDAHSLVVSNFYGRQRFEGNDPVRVAAGRFDPNAIPAILSKNISGISYISQWFSDRLELNLFGKRYYYNSESADAFSIRSSSELITIEDAENGYGLGSKWSFNNDFFIRFSFEKAVRLPNEFEVFGNFVTSRPNYSIRPEKSNNYNLGTYWRKAFEKNTLSVDLNTFYRAQKDLIFFVPNETGLGISRNISSAEAQGIEASFRASFAEAIDIGLNLTKQRIISTSTAFGDEPFFEQPIPSRPDFFASSSVTYKPTFLAREDRKFSMSWFTTFVDEFNFILEGARRNDDNYVPAQFVNDIGLSYELEDKNLSFSFQLNNILDREVFDLVSIPRPGRNFRFKVRYLLN